MQLNQAFFDNNKAVGAGLIIADTAVAAMKTFATMGGGPWGAAAAAAVVATGAVQLANLKSSSSGGGGTIGGVGGAPSFGAPQGDEGGEFDPVSTETSTTINAITEAGTSGAATVQIDFNADSGGATEQLFAATLNEMREKGSLDINQGG